MDYRNGKQTTAYIDVLLWLETASVEQIKGALSIAYGPSRAEIEQGIKAIMETDRPALAKDFSYLVEDPANISDLAKRYGGVAKAMELIAGSARKRSDDPTWPMMGFGELAAALTQLVDTGKLSRYQRMLLDQEIKRIRKSDDQNIYLWAE